MFLTDPLQLAATLLEELLVVLVEQERALIQMFRCQAQVEAEVDLLLLATLEQEGMEETTGAEVEVEEQLWMEPATLELEETVVLPS